jgi:hypothetical protein
MVLSDMKCIVVVQDMEKQFSTVNVVSSNEGMSCLAEKCQFLIYDPAPFKVIDVAMMAVQ